MEVAVRCTNWRKFPRECTQRRRRHVQQQGANPAFVRLLRVHERPLGIVRIAAILVPARASAGRDRAGTDRRVRTGGTRGGGAHRHRWTPTLGAALGVLLVVGADVRRRRDLRRHLQHVARRPPCEAPVRFGVSVAHLPLAVDGRSVAQHRGRDRVPAVRHPGSRAHRVLRGPIRRSGHRAREEGVWALVLAELRARAGHLPAVFAIVVVLSFGTEVVLDLVAEAAERGPTRALCRRRARTAIANAGQNLPRTRSKLRRNEAHTPCFSSTITGPTTAKYVIRTRPGTTNSRSPIPTATL